MSNFSKFTNEGLDIWIDINEIISVLEPQKVETSSWFNKQTYWKVNFMFKCGQYGYLNCWCEELAVNYSKMLRSKP